MSARASAKRFVRRLTAGGRRSAPGPAPETVPNRFLDDIPAAVPTDPRGPTIVLLNDCRDQVNYGAEALVDGLLRILADRIPDATIRPIPSHWVIDTSHGLGAFADGGAGLRQPTATYPTVADQFDVVADDWLAGRGGPDAQAVLRRFDGADLVVLNGEGSIYRTNLSAIRELFLAWLAKERLGIPTVYVNGGIHLTRVMPILPGMVRKTLPVMDAVAVREAWSLRNLQQYAPEVDALLFPDSAFVFSPDDARETEEVREVRRRIGESPYFCFDPGPMPMDTAALRELISALQAATSRAVMVCSAPADAFVEAIADETGALYVDTIADYREFMALTTDADYLVSGRYHNPILAAIMGCPTIALASTSHKVHGACEMLDHVSGSPYDSTFLRPDLGAIVEQARSFAADRAMWRERMQGICARRRTEVMGLGDLVNGVLRSRV